MTTLNFVMCNSQLFSITVRYKLYFQNVSLSGIEIISITESFVTMHFYIILWVLKQPSQQLV